MTVIVTDRGFQPEDWDRGFTPLSDLAEGTPPPAGIEIGPETEIKALAPHLGQIEAIRVLFPAFSDGRGFTHARRLRALGYTGRLRAAGHVLADQYAMARRLGFDEVEISDELAQRQPADQWQFRADWQSHWYQNRLRA